MTILEVIHKRSGSLNTGIGQLAHLLTVELIPVLAIELSLKLSYKLCMYEIEKSIAYIAAVVVIDR